MWESVSQLWPYIYPLTHWQLCWTLMSAVGSETDVFLTAAPSTLLYVLCFPALCVGMRWPKNTWATCADPVSFCCTSNLKAVPCVKLRCVQRAAGLWALWLNGRLHRWVIHCVQKSPLTQSHHSGGGSPWTPEFNSWPSFGSSNLTNIKTHHLCGTGLNRLRLLLWLRWWSENFLWPIYVEIWQIPNSWNFLWCKLIQGAGR